MLILPSTRLLLLLLLPAVAAALLPGPIAWLALLAGNGVLLGLAALDVKLSAQRDDLAIEPPRPGQLSLGEANTVYWHIGSRWRGRLRIQLRRDVDEGITAEPDLLSAIVPPAGHVDLTQRLRPARRGRLNLGAIHMRYHTALGLCIRQFRIEQPHAVKVFPSVANLHRYDLAVRQHRRTELGQVRQRQRGQGRIFESLREYVPGDEPGDIAWKATARRRRLMVRNYEVDRGQHIVILLDCGRLMLPQVDNLSRLDYAINASLLLTYAAMKQGDAIGMLAFHNEVRRYLPPRRGRAALSRMNEALYTLEPEPIESDYDGACRYLGLRHRKRSLIVCFTDVIDRDVSADLLGHLARFARRHVAVCVTIRNLELEATAAQHAESVDDCFARAVAIDMLNHRQTALAAMRRCGVGVLDLPPAGITPGVLQHYLKLKQRMRL